ncbi:MAG: DNA-directed RNA polymerase subunit K [Candidatus Woesearchaeota archaeon]
MDDIKYTRYEKARMIGARALQIAMGAPYVIKLTKKQLEEIRYSPLTIAEMEYEKKVIPLKIIRDMPKSRLEQEG